MKRLKTTLALLLAATAAPSLVNAQQYTVSTVAGLGRVAGFIGDGDLATGAQLYQPVRVSVDSKGNFYLSDYYVNRVRKVNASDGKISTIAGNGLASFAGDGAAATEASITDVHGIAADGNGNVYIADTSSSRIRKVDSSGVITTYAGTGTRGFSGDSAAAKSAQLWFPGGLAIDGSGNLFVADYGNSTVRRIAASGGNITTVAGTGTWGFAGDGGAANRALLGAPGAVAVDSAGNVYIGDSANNNIRKVTTDGNIRTIYSGVSVQSLAVDAAGNVYFVDGISPLVWKLLPNGTLLSIAGTGRQGFGGDGGAANLADFDHPAGIASDASGNIYVADTNNSVIRLLKPVSFSAGAVTNAASGAQGPLAPGEIVAVFGDKIGPTTLTQFTVSNGAIGTQLASAQIFFNGKPAPLIYVSAGVSAAIVPWTLAGASTVDVTVIYQGNTSATSTFPVAPIAPGIFTADSTGTGQAAAVNGDGSLNQAATPVKVGGFISLYLSGAGATNPAGQDGRIIPATDPETRLTSTVAVTIGGRSAVASYAGATPTSVAGLTQVNVQVPVGITTGASVPVTVSVGGVAAQSGVTIAVQP
ncbi:MAG: repeat containing protein [Bryobacterales bacterium]|nr:repeat containing protein [Bryobacterales bacterium]